MPIYEIEAAERWGVSCRYEVEAHSAVTAVQIVKAQRDAESVGFSVNWEDHQEVDEILSVANRDDPREIIDVAQFNRLKRYTVLLACPSEFSVNDGSVHPQTFLAHCHGITPAAAIAEARDMAAVECDCEDLEAKFWPLLVIRGHHDRVSLYQRD
jgi:hypothetical protein